MTVALLRRLRKKHFVEIVADVPWSFKTRSAKGITSRSAQSKYKTMTLDEIKALPVSDYAANNARLWFWVTGPFLAAGAHEEIMRAWGFEPTTLAFVWLKPSRMHFNVPRYLSAELFKPGNGYTTRQNAEFVIMGRRGAPPERLSKSVHQLILEPAREHSRKPEQFYRAIEQIARGPYLELFARQRRRGWTCRGDEVTKYG